MQIKNIKDANLVGMVCVNSIGRVGIATSYGVLGFGENPDNPCIKGIGIDGNGTWCASGDVCVLGAADQFRAKLSKRFGGKLSFNA